MQPFLGLRIEARCDFFVASVTETKPHAHIQQAGDMILLTVRALRKVRCSTRALAGAGGATVRALRKVRCSTSRDVLQAAAAASSNTALCGPASPVAGARYPHFIRHYVRHRLERPYSSVRLVGSYGLQLQYRVQLYTAVVYLSISCICICAAKTARFSAKVCY